MDGEAGQRSQPLRCDAPRSTKCTWCKPLCVYGRRLYRLCYWVEQTISLCLSKARRHIGVGSYSVPSYSVRSTTMVPLRRSRGTVLGRPRSRGISLVTDHPVVLSRTHHPIAMPGFASQTSDEPRPVSPTNLDSHAAVIYSAKAPSRRRGKEGGFVHAK